MMKEVVARGSCRCISMATLACYLAAILAATSPSPAVAALGRNRKILQETATTGGGEMDEAARARIVALLQEQAGVAPVAPIKTTINEEPASIAAKAEAVPFDNMFEKYSGFMHAYVDDLSARAVRMNFDVFKGVKDPWTENFKSFLDDESLHKMLEKGDAPPWVVAQKVNLDMWRGNADGMSIQEVLVKEMANMDLRAILEKSNDPVMKALLASSDANKQKLSAWSKMMSKWMNPQAGADGVAAFGGLPGMAALSAPLGGEGDLMKMFMSATANEKP